MAWRYFFLDNISNLKIKPSKTLTLPISVPHSLPWSPNIDLVRPYLARFISPFSTSFLPTKTPKKFKKKHKKKESPRRKLVQTEVNQIPHFEHIIERDIQFKFLIKSKQFLSKQPEHVLRLDDAGKLYHELGFPVVGKFPLDRAPSSDFETYRHTDGKMWFGFTEFMEELLSEEQSIMDAMETDRVDKVRKLLMMSANKHIPLSKIHHCRTLFGIPDDLRDRVVKYPYYFKIVVEDDGKRILELVNWDPLLAVCALEKEFMVDEDRAKKAFKFPVKYGKDLDLDMDDQRMLNLFNTLPLVSPYSEVSKLDVWTLEAEKYRVGVIHEFLSLTLEKRASIHHIVEFKDEFCLTKHTYHMLLRQPKAFYLAGTEMNWAVFLKDAYDENGDLIKKDPQVIFNEKLYKYAQMKEIGPESDFGTKKIM